MPDCTGGDVRGAPHPLQLDAENYCVHCGRGPFVLEDLAGGEEGKKTEAMVRLIVDLKPAARDEEI